MFPFSFLPTRALVVKRRVYTGAEVEQLSPNLIQQLDFFFLEVGKHVSRSQAVVIGLVKRKHVTRRSAAYLVQEPLPISILSDFTTALSAPLIAWLRRNI